MKLSIANIAALIPRRSILTLLGSSLLLVACGGDGGGGGDTGTGPGVLPPPARTAQMAYFVAKDPNLQQEHIYAESDEGGALQQLTPNSPVANANILSMALSPDRETIAYAANHDSASVIDLYLLPVSGGTPVKVTTTLPANTRIQQITWSPDSSQLAYVANPKGRSSRSDSIKGVGGIIF